MRLSPPVGRGVHGDFCRQGRHIHIGRIGYHVGEDKSRREGVDQDAVTGNFRGERSGQAIDTKLGRRVRDPFSVLMVP